MYENNVIICLSGFSCCILHTNDAARYLGVTIMLLWDFFQRFIFDGVFKAPKSQLVGLQIYRVTMLKNVHMLTLK